MSERSAQVIWLSFVPASPSLHGRCTLWAVPLPFGCFGQTHTAVVKPLDRTILVITADHLSVRHLVTNAVSGFIGVVSPVHLTAGVCFCDCGLYQFMSQS